MSIYTRTGDDGQTGLFGGGRVSKADPRVDAYGDVDELNAAVGLARSASLPPDVEAHCAVIQSQLFAVGAALATPLESKSRAHLPPVHEDWATKMEKAIDSYDAELPALTAFILPGGTPGASGLHLARCIARRAERRVVPLVLGGMAESKVVLYLNRLSDFLFTLARVANFRAGVADVPWTKEIRE